MKTSKHDIIVTRVHVGGRSHQQTGSQRELLVPQSLLRASPSWPKDLSLGSSSYRFHTTSQHQAWGPIFRHMNSGDRLNPWQNHRKLPDFWPRQLVEGGSIHQDKELEREPNKLRGQWRGIVMIFSSVAVFIWGMCSEFWFVIPGTHLGSIFTGAASCPICTVFLGRTL
jgi:hypothetical protein